MKKALIVNATLAVICASAFAQSSSTVLFKNRNIPTPDPNPTLPNGQPNPNYIAGGNGNGSYNVPIYLLDASGNNLGGAGLYPGGYTAGLYYQNNLLGTALLGTTVASAPFFVTPPNQELQIKDAAGNIPAPGSTPTLTIRVWPTAKGSFEAAKQDFFGGWGEWTFTSLPISGAGSPPSLPPSMTGWPDRSFSNEGVFVTIPEPSVAALSAVAIGALALVRRRR